jgi:hypothetical protein
MSSIRWSSLARSFAFVGAAVLAVGTASAQLASAPDSSHSATISATESSSNDYQPVTDAEAADPAASGAAAAGHGQYDNTGGGGHRGIVSRLAFEAGAGFNSPIGNDTPYITWGGNFTGGAGLHFSKRFSVLGEFQFIDDKLPGAFIAAANPNGGGNGSGGNAHIISLTASPVIDLFPKRSTGIYVVGGGGWYHKSTNFTAEECCDFYGYPVTVTADSFTSNQLGGDLGLGVSHRLGGVYGDGTMKLFAEARYLYIHTPSITENNGLGTTELIPVTFGIRW